MRFTERLVNVKQWETPPHFPPRPPPPTTPHAVTRVVFLSSLLRWSGLGWGGCMYTVIVTVVETQKGEGGNVSPCKEG